jgi:hypothetical protein
MTQRPAPENTADYIRFGDVARDRCGMQCQYASRYLMGELNGYPKLGEDLRWFGDTGSYHGLMIHKGDADEFVRRVRKHRTEGMMGWTGEAEGVLMDTLITTYGQYPAYREPGFEVVAFPNSLVAFAIDETGKHVRRVGDMDKPPHWGIWQGVVQVSAYSPDTSIFDLMELLRRGQTALRCKENRPNLNPRR